MLVEFLIHGRSCFGPESNIWGSSSSNNQKLAEVQHTFPIQSTRVPSFHRSRPPHKPAREDEPLSPQCPNISGTPIWWFGWSIPIRGEVQKCPLFEIIRQQPSGSMGIQWFVHVFPLWFLASSQSTGAWCRTRELLQQDVHKTRTARFSADLLRPGETTFKDCCRSILVGFSSS